MCGRCQQQASTYLPRHCKRILRGVQHILWVLEPRKLVFKKLGEILDRRLLGGGGVENDYGAEFLAHLFIRHPNHLHIFHAGMLIKRL